MRAVRSNSRTSAPPNLAPSSSGVRPTSAGLRWGDASSHSMALRLWVLMVRRRLDRRILTGSVTGPGAALALRGSQLTDPRSQRATARNLRRVLEHVDRCGGRPDRSVVVIDRTAVRASREAILGLAERLDRGRAVSARGMVQIRELIMDGASPLYGVAGGGALLTALWEISDALTDDQPWSEGEGASRHR